MSNVMSSNNFIIYDMMDAIYLSLIQIYLCLSILNYLLGKQIMSSTNFIIFDKLPAIYLFLIKMYHYLSILNNLRGKQIMLSTNFIIFVKLSAIYLSLYKCIIVYLFWIIFGVNRLCHWATLFYTTSWLLSIYSL